MVYSGTAEDVFCLTKLLLLVMMTEKEITQVDLS